MTNQQVINAFINGKAGKSLNMTSDGQRLYSYWTCIAEHTPHGYKVNYTRYSSTTSKQRNMLVRTIGHDDILAYCDNVPRGTQYLY